MTRQLRHLPTPGISPELLKLTIIMILVAALVMWWVSCGLYEAVVGAVESGDEAAQAAADAARQTEDTLAAIEHVVLIGAAYLAGEVRRPLWHKFRNRKNHRKKG